MSVKICIVDNTFVDLDSSLGATFGSREYSRIQSIKNPKRKNESLAALAALEKITEDVAGRSVERDNFGRPYFAYAENICFSISHSGSLSVSARAMENGVVIGVDLELIKEDRDGRTARIAERFFSEKEKAFFRRTQNSDGFYFVWTAKEAKSKRLGRGLSQLLSDNCPSEKNDDVFSYYFVEHRGERYALTLCMSKEEDIEILCDETICVVPATERIKETTDLL